MIPSRTWFPTNLPERAAFYVNFSKQFDDVAADLGFAPTVAAMIAKDKQVIEFLADVQTQFEAYKEAMRQYRLIITEGEIGATTPDFPAAPDFTLPVVVPTGMFERLNKLRTQIMASDNYTDEIGALLGIIGVSEAKPSPNEIKPVVTVVAAFEGYKFTVHATRMRMSAYQVQIRRMDSETWENAGVSVTSDIEITVTPKVPGQSERLQVRVILMDKNEKIGQPSDAVYVTVTP